MVNQGGGAKLTPIKTDTIFYIIVVDRAFTAKKGLKIRSLKNESAFENALKHFLKKRTSFTLFTLT